jgi:hypothetical protein
MSPVFLKMFQNEMVETGERVLAVEDMSGESMEQLLKHIYTGSVDKLSDLKVEIVLELLNASNKVNSSRNTWNKSFRMYSMILYQLIFLHNFQLHMQYELPQLKEYCEKILVRFCTVQNALEVLEYAKLYNLVEATKDIKSYISE